MRLITPMPFVEDDGGRGEVGFKGKTGDCATRAISIATGKPYAFTYSRINEISSQHEKRGKRKRGVSDARTGVYRQTVDRLMKEIGWEWIPTMFIGSGCQVHLCKEELPQNRPLLVCVSKHYVAVVNGVVRDTFDPSRGGMRCVYGYYQPRD